MIEKDKAYLVHCVRNRQRIVVPGRRSDRLYFAELQRSLSAQPGIVKVGVNPLAASVVIHSRTGFHPALLLQRFLDMMPAGRMSRPDAAQIEAGAGVASLPRAESNFGAVATKMIVALVTRQFGAQLIELCVEALVKAVLKRVQARRSERMSLVQAHRSEPLPLPPPRPLALAA